MRCNRIAPIVIVFPLVARLLAGYTAQPNFSGTWELDPAKSQDANGQAITLTIQCSPGKIDFQRQVHEADGKDSTSKFVCATEGAECDFDENGHKAKVSLWYNGPALMILKTNGPKEDSTTQWKLELSPDGHTLNVHYEHLEPTDKAQDLVFTKKS